MVSADSFVGVAECSENIENAGKVENESREAGVHQHFRFADWWVAVRL